MSIWPDFDKGREKKEKKEKKEKFGNSKPRHFPEEMAILDFDKRREKEKEKDHL